MKNEFIPNDVFLFIAEYVGSAQQLEVLLLISSEQNRAWTAEDVGSALNAEPISVGNRLINLWAKQLVHVNEGPPRTYRFAPTDPEMVNVVKKLKAAYEEHRTEVLESIYSKGNSRLRDFSDAFRFNRRKEDNDA